MLLLLRKLWPVGFASIFFLRLMIFLLRFEASENFDDNDFDWRNFFSTTIRLTHSCTQNVFLWSSGQNERADSNVRKLRGKVIAKRGCTPRRVSWPKPSAWSLFCYNSWKKITGKQNHNVKSRRAPADAPGSMVRKADFSAVKLDWVRGWVTMELGLEIAASIPRNGYRARGPSLACVYRWRRSVNLKWPGAAPHCYQY